MEFLAEVEDQARLCRANERRITEDDLVRMALVAGFKDRTLAEKVLAEEYDLRTTVQLAVTRENSKANVEAMQGKQGEGVRRMRYKQASDNSEDEEAMNIARLEEKLAVMKVRQQGKFSGRFKARDQSQGGNQEKCKYCDLSHDPGDCPAKGKSCYKCDGTDHYARAPACPKGGLSLIHI